MKIYTKTGDDGFTGVLGPGRYAKDDPRISAYGTVDELNAVLGLVRAQKVDEDLDALLAALQNQLFLVGAALADPKPGGPFHDAVTNDHASSLETEIDRFEAKLPPLTQFILPGGSVAAAQIHLARTVSRRAEREVVGLARDPEVDVPKPLLVYLNRLSDLLFVLGRVVNQRAGVPDVTWSKP